MVTWCLMDFNSISYIYILLYTLYIYLIKVKFEENWQIFKRPKMHIFTAFPHLKSSYCGAIMRHISIPWEAEIQRTDNRHIGMLPKTSENP